MVFDDPESALAASSAGQAVVLVVAPGAEPVGGLDQRRGRVALMVGCPQDETVRAAAAEMDAELFGPRP